MTEPIANIAFVALGSNLGDREGNIAQALAKLESADVHLLRCSRPLDNPAVGGPADSPPFINVAATFETTLGPRQLLERLLAVETELGRVRLLRWEPRVIDLDLLMYGERILDEPGLTLPHPRLHERRFVLLPLAEIAPDAVHPILGKTIRRLLDELPTEP